MEVKIGILLPRSDMFPTLAMDFLNGLKLSLIKLGGESIVPKFIFESVGNAVGDPVLRAAEKLILQENVDLTISFCSIFKLKELVGIFNAYKKPLVHIDLGGNVLKKEHVNPYVIHHTLNLWQSCYISGVYAAKNFGKKGAVITSFYDGGYHLIENFVRGFNDNGGSIVFSYVSPMDYKTETFDLMLNGLNETKPDVIFSLFSYKEAIKVFQTLAKSPLNGQIPIVAGAMMTDENTHSENYHIENVHSLASWNFEDETAEQRDFQNEYLSDYGAAPNIISLLGYEVGLTISACIEKENRIPENIGEFVHSLVIRSTRGDLGFNSYNESSVTLNKVRKFEFNETHYINRSIDEVQDPETHKLYEEFQDLPYSGWQNPYLCT